MPEPGSEAGDAVRADRFHDSGATAVQELAFALAEAVDRLAAGERKISFVYAAGSNFFFEIAKLRAARLLWAQVINAFQVEAGMRLQARTATSNKSLYDPYTNLLRVTTEALSAVLGGCDSLIVEPFAFRRAWARMYNCCCGTKSIWMRVTIQPQVPTASNVLQTRSPAPPGASSNRWRRKAGVRRKRRSSRVRLRVPQGCGICRGIAPTHPGRSQ